MRTRGKILGVTAITLGVWAGARWMAPGAPATHAAHAPVASLVEEPPAAAIGAPQREAVVAAGRPTEARAMEHDLAALDALLAGDPAEALAAAGRDDVAYPSSPLRAERKWVEIQALVHLEQIGAARSLAYDFYAAYPDHPRADAIEAMTGMHRGRVAANAGPRRAPESP
jgi:hypothetical protein